MKYAAIVAVAIWLAVVLWIGGLVLRSDPVARLVVPPAALSDSAALQTDTARVHAALAAIEPLRMAQMDAPASSPALMATLATGLAAAPVPVQPGTAADAAAASVPERTVSLVYHADGFRRAFIDGVYVHPGSRLPGGLRVVDISNDAVVLRDAQGRRRILRVARGDRGAGTPNTKVSR